MNESGDESALASHAATLADAVVAAVPDWVEACVERVLVASGCPVDPDVRAEATAAGLRAADEVGRRVRALLGRDIDDQADTPLAILRGAVEYPTEVLRRAGVPPVERDAFARRSFPTDVYGLAPANLADVAPELAEPGLVWGAAKAHVHLARRRREAT